jgi:hypothetical protein
MLIELTRALNLHSNYLYFMVTSRCNAFCDFCWNWKNVADAGKLHRPGDPVLRKELSLEEIDRFTRKLPSMLLVDFFGGESFFRQDLKEIISLFAVNVAFGVLAKALPQLNILVLSFSVTALVGLLVLFMTVPEFQGAVGALLGRIGDWMDGMAYSMAGR